MEPSWKVRVFFLRGYLQAVFFAALVVYVCVFPLSNG